VQIQKVPTRVYNWTKTGYFGYPTIRPLSFRPGHFVSWSFCIFQIIFTVTHVQHFIQVSHMSPLSYDKPLLVICPIIGSLQQLLENVYMKFYISKRSLSLGMNLCRFSYRGWNDRGRNVAGDEMNGTKWTGTKWKGTKCNATVISISH
jgi:hypothetical protein